MPNSQQMTALQNELIAIANTIETKVNLLADKINTLDAAKTAKEELSGSLLAPIATNTILYKNEDARRSAFIEAKALSPDYDAARTAERAAVSEKMQIEAEIELNRKTYRAKELLLLFYANAPDEQMI